jgi:hypothetical protein
MKKLLLLTLFFVFVRLTTVFSQVYTDNSSELIFAFSDVQLFGEKMDTKMRFTGFLHLGENVHMDLNNNLGFFTGYGLRNIGLITKEGDTEIRRRTYSFGVPLALKLGSFKDNLYVYGGGEYEMFFHYKQKLYINGDRKARESEWFSDRTKRFVPSVFAGIQFPKGINLKVKYYLENFLNRDYAGTDFGIPVNYADFNRTQIFYIALSYSLRREYVKKITKRENVRTVSY